MPRITIRCRLNLVYPHSTPRVHLSKVLGWYFLQKHAIPLVKVMVSSLSFLVPSIYFFL